MKLLDGIEGIGVSFGLHLFCHVRDDGLVGLDLVHESQEEIFVGLCIPTATAFAGHDDDDG